MAKSVKAGSRKVQPEGDDHYSFNGLPEPAGGDGVCAYAALAGLARASLYFAPAINWRWGLPCASACGIVDVREEFGAKSIGIGRLQAARTVVVTWL